MTPSTAAADGSPTAVAVVGSLNWDLHLQVESLPAPGETTVAAGRLEGPGGKGANQAAMAGRLGSETTMVGCVGADAAGEAMRAALAEAGVRTDSVTTGEGASGGAVVIVERGGENSIVIDPGANAELAPAHLEQTGLAEAAVVLTNFEVPLETVAAVPAASSGICILNPAPAPREPLPADLLEGFDVVVPNRGELAVLVGVPVPESPEEVAAVAQQLPAQAIVVTLGGAGALVCRPKAEPVHIPSSPANPIDTSGAGDAFCGALADGLARGLDLEAAARRATVVAAIVTEHVGAAAPPTIRAELDARLGSPG